LAALPLDQLEPVDAQVGYGELGRSGRLGYENGSVVVGGEARGCALSSHPPAILRYSVPEGYVRFRCSVALNDDVATSGSYAAFTVVSDGRVVAEVPFVRAGGAPVPINAEIMGASTIELHVATTRWAYCHAVWLDPVIDVGDATGWGSSLSEGGEGTGQRIVTDPLGRTDVLVPRGIGPVDRCIVTAASAGFEQWVDDLLGSVRLNGGCPDALLVVFALGDAPELERVAANHGAIFVPCRLRAPLDPNIKAVMYSSGHVIPAARFICLDADMLVLDDLSPLFATIDACPPNALLVCGEGNDHGIPNLASALDTMYGGGADPPFFRRDSALGQFPLVVNDGLLAGSRTALCSLHAEIRDLPGVIGWVDASRDCRWRNQFAANVALARLGSAVELDPSWNIQLHVQDVQCDGTAARWLGRSVRILHFSGWGKRKLPEFRQAVRAQRQIQAAPPTRRPRFGGAAAGVSHRRDSGKTSVRDLCERGRFEEALALARDLKATGIASPKIEEELGWLEAAMAPPEVGAYEPGQRSWASDLPRGVLLRIQQAVHHQRYRGRQLVKSPFDLAMYHQLLEQVRPGTIVEIGSKDGGSALWLGGLAQGLAFETHVHSYDIVSVTDADSATVTFHRGDGRCLGDSIDADEIRRWRHPLLVIDDADHAEETTRSILQFFHPHLRDGDYVVVEDGNLSDLYPEVFPEHSSGPHRALRRFLAEHRWDYEIDAGLCDLFGYNATTASNGILRRRSRPVQSTPDGSTPPPSTSERGQAVLRELSCCPWSSQVVPEAALAVPSMLSHRERQLLHWLAKHHVAGIGRVVDGGSFLGGSTAALASGLAARRDGEWDRTICAYDLFRVEEYTVETFGACFPDPTIGASFRSTFDANVARWARYIEVREGDACDWGWTGEPIELLFLDMVKTWPLNDLVLEKFLPFLIPGHSVIIQQDYLMGYGPWTQMTMELMEPGVAILDSMPNGSVAYLLTEPVPRQLLGAKLRQTLSAAEQRTLMDRAVGRWQGDERGLVELARMMLIAELDGPADASRELARVLERHTGQDRVEQAAAFLAGYLA